MNTKNYLLDEFILNESFQRFVLNKSAEDVVYWESWIANNPDSSETVTNAHEIITFIASRKVLPKNQLISEQVYERLQRQIHAEMAYATKQSRKINIHYYWYAASIIILIGLAFFYKHYFPSQSELSGQYLEVTVLKGQRSQLLLPDGTQVWLNSGSIFKYPVNFLKQGRNVYIEGEAFFNVTHKKNNLPFIVHLKEKLSIKVLGTEFNVKSYAEDKIIETTLVKGQIKLIKEDASNKIISELNIKPNEKAIYQKRNKQIIITSLISVKEDKIRSTHSANIEASKADIKEIDDVEIITSWKNEELVFQDETFEDIGVKMERWFGLKITITDENLKKERFTGKFANKETIYQILDIFNRSEPIQYNSKNKEIIISKKSKKH